MRLTSEEKFEKYKHLTQEEWEEWADKSFFGFYVYADLWKEVIDGEITTNELCLLLLIGLREEKDGWCRESDTFFIEHLHLGKTCVKRGIENLINKKWLKRKIKNNRRLLKTEGLN